MTGIGTQELPHVADSENSIAYLVFCFVLFYKLFRAGSSRPEGNRHTTHPGLGMGGESAKNWKGEAGAVGRQYGI